MRGIDGIECIAGAMENMENRRKRRTIFGRPLNLGELANDCSGRWSDRMTFLAQERISTTELSKFWRTLSITKDPHGMLQIEILTRFIKINCNLCSSRVFPWPCTA